MHQHGPLADGSSAWVVCFCARVVQLLNMHVHMPYMSPRMNAKYMILPVMNEANLSAVSASVLCDCSTSDGYPKL